MRPAPATAPDERGHNAGPAIARHYLGSYLRQQRQQKSLRLTQVAGHLGVTPSTLSRIETGLAPTRPSFLTVLLTLYGIDNPAEHARLTSLAHQSQRQHWWTSYDDLISPATGRYLALEITATRLRCYSPHVIPDLLCTPG